MTTFWTAFLQCFKQGTERSSGQSPDPRFDEIQMRRLNALTGLIFIYVGMFKHRPDHIVGDNHPGVVPLDNEVGIERDREVFVGNLLF